LWQLARAYFGISYINHDDKHIVKEDMNRLIKSFSKGYISKVRKVRNPRKVPSDAEVKARKKPILLICAESFSSEHAMYRSWGPRIETLQHHFDVHFMAPEDCVDDQILKKYPNFITVKYTELGGMFLYIEYLRPDMILFPSVGMRITNIMLSNQRLAPVQAMMLGHPATTHSRYIDFIVGPEEFYDERAFPKDKYVIDPSPRKHQTRTEFDKLKIQRQKNTHPKNLIEIGVAGSLLKLSHSFIELLKQIEDEADFDVRYSFSINQFGVSAIANEILLKKQFPSARVFGYQQYTQFFQRMEQADIILNPFPFGHSNTLIDSLLAGKPSLGLHGIEPHNRAIGALLKKLDLDDQFLTYSIEEYKEKFFHYARRILKGERDFFDPQDVYNRMFVTSDETDNIGFGNTINWAYKNSKQIKSSAEKLFTCPTTQSD
jgi:hypothetical protein